MRTTLLFLLICFLSFSCKKSSDNTDLLTGLTPDSWHWLDIDSMFCRDGSNTGIGVRLTNSENLMIFLEGGGACFDAGTCEDNPSSFNETDFDVSRFTEGIFNNSKTENPFKDWNIIYVPYCTGDVHSGNTDLGIALGVDVLQKFRGYRNFGEVMKIASGHFNNKGVKKVALVGLSAGGFGTHVNFDQLASNFKNSELFLINDSGPLTNDQNVLPLCLQFGLQFIFRIPITSDVVNCCIDKDGYSRIYTYLSDKYPQHHFALICYLTDPTIRSFLQFGQGECSNANEISGEAFANSLYKLRDDLLIPTDNWSTFLAENDWHTFTSSDSRFYDTKVSDVFLHDFMRDFLSGESKHISPE